jgi:two-component system nitrogen regulation response regulator GlnG
MSRVLIVDDEPTICWSVREALAEQGHTVEMAPSAEEGARRLEAGWQPHLVVLDVRLPGQDGLSALVEWRERWPGLTIVIMTAFGDLETAVRALHHGAFDYLIKPFDLDHALEVFRRALELQTNSGTTDLVASPKSQPAHEGHLVGRSAAMQQIFRQIALVAPSSSSVLITGESGTGKELVARAIHRHSPRRDAPFVPVCLPALSPSLVEAELFGHARGAFTGAQASRPGLFELAHEGTLLLDEIGDIPESLQIKLLRVLEQREFFPVGSTELRRVDVRVLAATNRPLEESVANGRFRRDLFFRLNAVPIAVPPLRDRDGDIRLLAEHFLGLSSSHHSTPARLSHQALDLLQSHHWPGNVRELRNAMEHAAVHARLGTIGPDHLPPSLLSTHSVEAVAASSSAIADRLQHLVAEWAQSAVAPDSRGHSTAGLYEALLSIVEPPLLRTALEHSRQNRAAAASLLGLHRETLRNKLRAHDLE